MYLMYNDLMLTFSIFLPVTTAFLPAKLPVICDYSFCFVSWLINILSVILTLIITLDLQKVCENYSFFMFLHPNNFSGQQFMKLCYISHLYGTNLDLLLEGNHTLSNTFEFH